MNKLAIPSLLLGVVMIAGAFAFMPVQEASTVHTTVLQGTTEIQTLAAAANSCDNDDDSEDGTITWNMDNTSDSGLILDIIIDATAATDADDTIALELNVDGVERFGAAAQGQALVLDAAPATIAARDLHLFETFDMLAGDPATIGEVNAFGSIAFTDTFTIDVDCTQAGGGTDVGYTISAVVAAPGGATFQVSDTIA